MNHAETVQYFHVLCVFIGFWTYVLGSTLGIWIGYRAGMKDAKRAAGEPSALMGWRL